jgi:hypothetical protein
LCWREAALLLLPAVHLFGICIRMLWSHLEHRAVSPVLAGPLRGVLPELRGRVCLLFCTCVSTSSWHTLASVSPLLQRFCCSLALCLPPVPARFPILWALVAIRFPMWPRRVVEGVLCVGELHSSRWLRELLMFSTHLVLNRRIRSTCGSSCSWYLLRLSLHVLQQFCSSAVRCRAPCLAESGPLCQPFVAVIRRLRVRVRILHPALPLRCVNPDWLRR